MEVDRCGRDRRGRRGRCLGGPRSAEAQFVYAGRDQGATAPAAGRIGGRRRQRFVVMDPYYESRFIRANHPNRPVALWLRETLVLTSGGAASADVWVMVFDPDNGGNLAIKQPHPVEDAEFRYDTWTARIGETTIDDTCARGTLAGPRAASWDLRITGGGEPVKLLTDRQYSARFPSAKTQVRSPLARFDGHVLIEDKRVDLDGWKGSVNHNWGRRHTPAYAF